MKKILVPIDFTTYSNNAFRMATFMARIKGMSIKLLHIIEEPRLGLFAKKRHDEYLDEMETETREHLKRLVSLENTAELNVEYEIRRSKTGVAREILKEECDVIIIGRSREEQEGMPWTGSVTEKIVRLSAIPVITVSHLPDNYSIRKIVFAADFEEEDKVLQPFINRALDLSKIFNSELLFLHIIPNREYFDVPYAEEKSRKILANYDLGGYVLDIKVAPTPEEGISDYVNDADPDLLVLATHGKTGILHFFLGSTTENTANYADVPVLTYNMSGKKMEMSSRPITREKASGSKRIREKS